MKSIDDLSDDELLNEQLNLIRDCNYEDHLSLFSKVLECSKSSNIDLDAFRKDFEAYINKVNAIYKFDKHNMFDFAMEALPTNAWVKTLRVFGYTSKKLNREEASNPRFMHDLDKKLKGEYYH